MPMQLVLARRADDLTDQHLAFIRQRSEIARNMVPDGFEDSFRRHARIRSAHGSVSFKEDPLDLATVQLATLDDSSFDHQRREARNAERAHRLVKSLSSDETIEVDVGLLRMLNTILFESLPGRGPELAGRFRRGSSRITKTAARRFTYTGPPPTWVAGLMSGFISQIGQWLRHEEPEIAAAQAHFGLLSIRPFVDGNGRIARLLADLILAIRQSDVDGMISPSSVMRRRRSEYFEALQNSQGTTFAEQVDVTDFVRFHTEVIADAVRQLEARANTFQQRRLALLSNFQSAINDRRVVGLNSLQEIGQLSSSQYAKITKCARPTAFTDLNTLAEASLVVRLGRGKATRYELAPEVRVMLESAG
ncbi:MAG: Fic family protein [Chloroflexi bacterium]|nr:Fic family protein [Chloroflexota bacterium]